MQKTIALIFLEFTRILMFLVVLCVGWINWPLMATQYMFTEMVTVINLNILSKPSKHNEDSAGWAVQSYFDWIRDVDI